MHSIQLIKVKNAVRKILLLTICSTLYLCKTTFGQTVTKQLYLSSPGQSLDRIDPVATADGTLDQTLGITPSSQYLYAFRGASKTDFWRYDIVANTWATMAATPGVISRGAALTTNGVNIYALRGASNAFWRYDPVANTWSVLANTPVNASSGAALVHLNGIIYAFTGDAANTFYQYNIATNIWSPLAGTPPPSKVDWGGSLTTDGTNIYALRGNNSNAFWKYTILTNTWSVLSSPPATINAGGALSFDGIAIYALRGGSTNNFYKYNIGANTWSTLANTTNTISIGGALASDDPNTYALRGNASNNFWKFNGTAWSSLANTPSNVDSGGAVIKFGSTSKTITFTQSPALCSNLIIKAGVISVTNYISLIYGTLPVYPALTATLKYGATTIITLVNPIYNSTTGLVTWAGNLSADISIPAGQTITLDITTQQVGVSFSILYDSQTKPSKIEFPVSTYINVSSVNVYNAAFPLGTVVATTLAGSTRYIRTTVTDPFGFADITGLNVTVTPPGSTVAAISVNAAGCTRVYENSWTVPAGTGTYSINATAKEGYENTVTHSGSTSITTCVDCPPTANKDFAIGNGGEPLDIDVLANDTDPNNNINPVSLTILVEPKNGNVIIDNNRITYLPNGIFSGNDTLTYEICDLTAPTPLCASTQVIVNVLPVTFNTCADAVKSKLYYIPYAEDDAQIALKKSSSSALASTNLRTIISLKISYPGMTLVWDHWEDGYEINILNPTQLTTQIWGDGNIYNGFAPGYPTDIIPAGGSIVLDNTMATPRVASSIFYDGKDKLYSSAQISVTQVCGEPSTIAVQCMKTNVSAYPTEFGKSFTLPVGQDLPSRDFLYTALFLRAAENNTSVEMDRDNDGSFETKFTLNEGQVMRVDDATLPSGIKVKAGAVITSDKPIGLDAHFAGVDNYSSREVPIFPATWYSNIYYTPVPTTGPAVAPHDTAVVMLYNSLSRDLNINWTSGLPSSGTILLKANSAERFAMPLSATAAYKFTNPTKESFVALEIVDSYTPGGGGNDGATRDWAFNLISEARLTDFASVAWAPGSIDMTRNDNPIWVTPTANTIVYVKYDGDVLNGPSISPCGLKYDVAIPLNALNYTKIKDASDNNQGGTSVFTCNGAKIAAVYGEDPATALAGSPSWDVGSTIQSFCKEKLIFANIDNAVTLVNTPVTIDILKNDAGFLAIIDPATVKTAGLLQPLNGSIIINTNGSIIYTPNTAFVGLDSFKYNVCSTPFPVVCGTTTVYVTIGSCPSPSGKNIISGQVFLDKNQDGVKNDGGTGLSPAKIYLYVDGNCNNLINTNELVDSVNVDVNGYYQFIKSPEKIIADNFDGVAGGNTCAAGSDGTATWKNDWVDAGDPSTGFCVTPAQSAANTDVEIVQDSTFSFALRLDDASRSATREFNLEFATKAFLSFSYRKATTSLSTGENIFVQLSNDGSIFNTIYTIAGNSTFNSNYVDVANISINTAAYNIGNKAFIRFATNSSTDEGDLVFIDNISIKFLQYDQCYLIGLNPASLATNTFLTTAATRSFKFNTSGTCENTLDFGAKKISTYAVNDENSTWQDVNVSGVVKQNDFDQEANTQNFGSFLNTLNYTSLASGASISGKDKTGTFVANAATLVFTSAGNYAIDPETAFTGTISLPYSICDNGSPAACDTAFLVITVDPLPSAANSVIANNDEDISYGNSITNSLFVNDRDPKSFSFSAISYSYDTNGDGIPDVTTLPGASTVAGVDMYNKPVLNAGTLSINSSGVYVFTPVAGFVGSIDASYLISNTAGAIAGANLHIDVLANINGTQNDPPFAGDDFGYTTVNQPVTGSFIANDSDPNGDQLSLNGTTITTGVAGNSIGAPVATVQGGSVQFYTNGTYTYTAPVGYMGPDYVTYSICDVTTTAPQPLCANAILHFLIAPGINISGKVWNDANGDVKDTGEPATNAGGQLYVTLVDDLGYVVSAVAVANDGTYNFNNASPGKYYSLVLSTSLAVPGTPSNGASLANGWINTGETRNGIIDYGAFGVIDNRLFGFSNAANMNFGIEKLPNSDAYYIHIKPPVVGQFITLNGGTNPPILSGKDAEDCVTYCTLEGRTVSIDSIPLNASLWYNGSLVTSGQVINNFDASQFKVEITSVTMGTMFTIFYYSFIDAAGMKDPNPVVYSLNWLIILPATGLNLTATRVADDVSLNWKTISEINSEYFDIERSTDGRNYIKIGTPKKAAGTSNTEKQYQSADNIRDLQAANIYYRVKLTDIRGKYAYSNVAIIKLPENATVKALPNPFVSAITISFTVEQSSTFLIRMMDMSGRTVWNGTHKITKEMPRVTISNLDGLSRGIYLVEITDLQSGKKRTVKLEKAR